MLNFLLFFSSISFYYYNYYYFSFTSCTTLILYNHKSIFEFFNLCYLFFFTKFYLLYTILLNNICYISFSIDNKVENINENNFVSSEQFSNVNNFIDYIDQI